ncbi:MAG: hypothetical protein LBP20_01355 [Treponema sp.]|jgi:hypothetical protein|nr:hypothetical protein [Treponema sp.]
MRNYLWIVLCLAFSMSLGAQEENVPEETAGPELPRQFRGISLGMGLEELKTALAADSLFAFRGDRDVSFLPDPQQSLVETTGLSFIKRAFFQLNDGALFIMAFTMNTDLVDYYSLFTAFNEKYGPPGDLSPRQSVWENGSTRLTLERPLTVKYVDMGIFNEITGESTVQKTRELRLRQEFIDAF